MHRLCHPLPYLILAALALGGCDLARHLPDYPLGLPAQHCSLKDECKSKIAP